MKLYHSFIHNNIIGSPIYKLLLLLVLIFGCHTQASAQSGKSPNPLDTEALFKNLTPPTPAASALIQNIVYPMNYSTGLPEIKIPLYEVKCGDLTLPIYLTYHASGVKLSDLPGLVGLGWNLTAEPMISRTIKGRDDQSNDFQCKFDKSASSSAFYLHNLEEGNNDEQPDEYYYQLPTKQGLFMYAMEPVDKSRKYLSVPYDNLLIERKANMFQITDDDGTLYKFGGGIDRSGIAMSNTIGWRASSILAPNRKDSISFAYQPGNAHQVKLHNDYIVVVDDFDKKYFFEDNRHNDFIIQGAPVPDELMQTPIIYNTINNKTHSYQLNDKRNLVPDWFDYYQAVSSPVVQTWSAALQEIRYPGGKVVFSQQKNTARLQTISVYDNIGNLLREVRFSYYIPSPYVSERYFLENVTVTGKQGTAKETYKFGYYKRDYLPNPGDRRMDYWGYFNGVTRPDTASLVPRQTIEGIRHVRDIGGNYFKEKVTFNIGSEVSREANEEYMKYGTLNSITYPTGSTDEFIYEAHRYRTREDSVHVVGGLRVKQIKSKGENGDIKVRTFTYGRNEDGTGKSIAYFDLEHFRLDQMKYYSDPLEYMCDDNGCYFTPAEGRYYSARYRTFFSNPVRPITYDGGSAVMYDYVTEYDGTPSSNSGKTLYRYYVDSFSQIPDEINNFQNNRHLDWQYGHLVEKTIYRNSSGVYTPLEETVYNYSIGTKNFGKILIGEACGEHIRKPVNSVVQPDVYNQIKYSRTEVNVAAKLLTGISHKVYAGGNATITSTTNQHSDPTNILLTQTTESGNAAPTRTVKLYHPKDYSGTVYTKMLERNMLSPVVKEEHTSDGKVIVLEKPYTEAQTGIYLPSSLKVGYTASGSTEERAHYYYDNFGRLAQETRDGNRTVAYLYGYNRQPIIARIENVLQSDVKYELGGESAVDEIAKASVPTNSQWSAINGLRNKFPNAQVTTYAYNPQGNISSITDPRGVKTSYEYDELGRLMRILLANGSVQEVIEEQEYHYAE